METTEKMEIESRANRQEFVEQYIAARKKAAEKGYAELTSWEKLVLEKGDDYLLG